MPTVLDPNNKQGRAGQDEKEKGWEQLQRANFEYKYPRNKDLKPGSDFHDQLVDRIMVRARESYRVMKHKHEDWREIDKSLRAYVPPENKEDEKESKPKIVMPQTFATLETLLTYMFSAFMQSPIFNYEGTGPEDVLGAQLMTKLIDYQCTRTGVGLSLHTQFRDAFAYGIGAVHPKWTRKHGKTTEKVQKGTLDMFNETVTITDEERRTSKRKLLFEGNELENIDPYRYLPDPNMPAHEVQDSEYVGWIERTNYTSLLKRDRDNDDFIFNGKYLQFIDGQSSLVTGESDEHRENQDAADYLSTVSPVDVIWMYVDIIPNEWDFGSSQYPETWLFGVSADKVIVAAQPLGLDHGMKPIAVTAPDFDGYSASPVSRLGMVHDIQNLIDFLYSSHIQNVRKAINDMFIIDPSLVNYHDAADPKPGKLIRMRRAAWGRGAVGDAIKQFDVQDVTQGHVGDSDYLTDVMNQVASTNENLQGSLANRTSRISASEAKQVRSSGLSRLEKVARIISMQSMIPVGMMFASHTQQLMEEETFIKVTGEWKQKLQEDFGREVERNRTRVRPTDLVVNYDVVPHDGTIPGSENVQSLTEIMGMVMQNPMVAQQFDMFRMVKHIARQSGVKNVDDFVKQAENTDIQVQPDQQVQQQAQQGNLIPQGNGQR